jgi:hypothetical protein
MNMHRFIGEPLAIAGAILSAVASTHAVTNYWADLGTDWNTAANWYNDTNTINDVAAFTNATYSAQPVVGGNYNLGMIWQAGSGAVTLTGPLNTLSLYGVTNAGVNYGIRMDSGAGALTISNRITVARAQTWLNNSSSLLTLSTNVALNTALTVDGTGTNRVYGVISGTTTLNKDGTGRLEIYTTPSFTGTLNLRGGSMLVSNVGSLNVTANIGGAGTDAVLTIFMNANYLPTYGSSKAWIVGNQGVLTLARTSAGVLAYGDNAVGAQLIVTNGGKLVLAPSVTNLSPTGGGTGNRNNTFKVIGGPGGVSVADWGGAGFNFGISNHVVVIDGAGTIGGAIVTNVNALTVANQNNSRANSLTVTNGGKLFTGIGGADSYIVNRTSAGQRLTNNWVEVTGTGSVWNNNGRTLFVTETGANTTGIYNRVSVSTGGLLTNTSLTIGSGAGYQANNYLELKGGSVYAKTVTVNKVTNYIALNSGTLNVANKIVYSNSTAFVVGNGTDAATLVLQNTGTHFFQAGLTVANNGTLMAVGTIPGGVTVQAGGTLAPGNSPGLLIVSDLTLQTGANLALELDSTSSHDQVRVTGSTLSVGGANLVLTWAATPNVSDTFLIIDNQTAGSVSGEFAGWAHLSTQTVSGVAFQIDYQAGDGNDVLLTTVVIPEPSSLVLVVLGLGCGWLVWSKRRHA